MSKKVIFCFTFAGGTASFYDKLNILADENIELVKLDYPGHGTRHREKLCSNFDEVSEILYSIIKEHVISHEEISYALLGYSMGSIAVFSMIQHIKEKSEIKEPVCVFIAAHEPLTNIDFLGIPAEQMDEAVKQRTIEFGAVPVELIENKVFWRMYLPVYKADYLMIARYNFSECKFRTKVPTTIFFSEDDTRYEDMKLWKNYYIGDCQFIEYSGPHFFINEHYEEIAEVIKERMENL